jgi:polyisoprenoid-binding protein YceI
MLRKSALFLAATAATLGAQSAKIAVVPASSITVEGTSNVHAWHLTSATFTTDIEMVAPVAAAAKVEAVTLTLPVTTLKSGKGGLDKNTYKALNAEKHPDITFRMTSYDAVPSASAAKAIVKGMLTVNGVSKEVALDATITGDAASGLKAVGTTKFQMTDFGVKPVTALMGAIKTGNDVTIKFALTGTVAQRVAMLPAAK